MRTHRAHDIAPKPNKRNNNVTKMLIGGLHHDFNNRQINRDKTKGFNTSEANIGVLSW